VAALIGCDTGDFCERERERERERKPSGLKRLRSGKER